MESPRTLGPLRDINVNKEYRQLDEANTRWKRRQYSRLLAIAVGLLSLSWFALSSYPQRPELKNDVKVTNPSPLDDLTRLELEMSKPERTVIPSDKWQLVARNGLGSMYYKDWARLRSGDAEVWLKVVPKNPKQFVAAIPYKYGRRLAAGLSHSLQLTVFHCDNESMSIQKTTLYRKNGTPIISDSSLFTTYRDRIEPDTTNREVYDHFCKNTPQ